MEQIIGTVAADGAILVKGSDNWTSRRTREGQYQIQIQGDLKLNRDTVILCGSWSEGVGGVSTDNVFTPFGISVQFNHFEVVSLDVNRNNGELQDAPFSFQVLIP